MRLTARDLDKIPHREFRNREILARTGIARVSTDSRTTQSGDLYVALRGASFDGHAFVGAAFAAGACAAVVEEEPADAQAAGKPLLLVADTARGARRPRAALP